VVGRAGRVLERGPGEVDLARGVLEAALVVREPRERQVAVLLRLRLGQREGLAGDELRARGVRVPLVERDLREEQATLHLPPRVREGGVDLRRRARELLGRGRRA